MIILWKISGVNILLFILQVRFCFILVITEIIQHKILKTCLAPTAINTQWAIPFFIHTRGWTFILHRISDYFYINLLTSDFVGNDDRVIWEKILNVFTFQVRHYFVCDALLGWRVIKRLLEVLFIFLFLFFSFFLSRPFPRLIKV